MHEPDHPAKRRCELSGHRGARGLWPENTLPGFAGALALGVDAIELDVALSADGVPVVVHDLALDPDLVRGPDGDWLARRGAAVRSLDRAALARLDVGRARPGSAVARAHPRQRPADGARIPSLAEICALLAAHPAVLLDAELKTGPERPAIGADPEAADPEELAELVAQAAREAGLLDRLAVRSFDWRGLRHAARRWPGVPRAYLTEDASAAALDAVLAETPGPGCAWAPGHARLTPALIAAAQAAGLAVKPWTVNHPADMARLVAWGVDGICTDDPDIGRAVLAQAGLPLGRMAAAAPRPGRMAAA